MSLYAWKIVAPARPPHEKIGTLDELEAYLNASGLPDASPANPIIERTRLMQLEGQGYYKESTNGKADPCYGLNSVPVGRARPLIFRVRGLPELFATTFVKMKRWFGQDALSFP